MPRCHTTRQCRCAMTALLHFLPSFASGKLPHTQTRSHDSAPLLSSSPLHARATLTKFEVLEEISQGIRLPLPRFVPVSRPHALLRSSSHGGGGAAAASAVRVGAAPSKEGPSCCCAAVADAAVAPAAPADTPGRPAPTGRDRAAEVARPVHAAGAAVLRLRGGGGGADAGGAAVGGTDAGGTDAGGADAGGADAVGGRGARAPVRHLPAPAPVRHVPGALPLRGGARGDGGAAQRGRPRLPAVRAGRGHSGLQRAARPRLAPRPRRAGRRARRRLPGHRVHVRTRSRALALRERARVARDRGQC